MAEENVLLDSGSALESSNINTQTCDIVAIYGSKDPNKGYNIPPDKIERLTIHESFFSLLPSMTLRLNDVGTIFHDVNFQIGNTLYVSLLPKSSDEDVILKPILQATFVIQAINYSFDQDRNDFIYNFHCIYSAEKYLNDICIWPMSDTIAGYTPSLDKAYTSAETLSSILANAGLKPIVELKTDPDDNMSWLNANLTYAEFAKKIISHAWISDDDMPLLFVDHDGVAHYTSINNLCDEQQISGYYIHQTKYQKKYDDKNQTNHTNKKPEAYKVYLDVSMSNYGYIQNNGGYNVKKYIYNPYNIKELSLTEFKPVPFDLSNPTALTTNDNCFRSRDFIDSGINGKLRLANVSNRSVTQGDTVRYNSVSVHFKQTHQYYDYAPLHHDSIKHAFFQQFAFMAISVTDQPGYAQDPEQQLRLGNKINIDMSSINHDSSVQTNNFIVTGLTHDISFGSKYTIMATCVSDGIGGTSQIKKESKDSQKSK